MGRQRPSQKKATQVRVRQREGNSCAVCGIDIQLHKKRYGHILEVHRIEPGSVYSTTRGVCVTLCKVCHNAVEGKCHWGWIQKKDIKDEEDLARHVRRSSEQDCAEEAEWRKREAWGAMLKGLRVKKFGGFVSARRGRTPKKRSTVSLLEGRADVPHNIIEDLEAGRREPLLFEVKRLAKALEVPLDELASEPESTEDWREANQQQSDLRALAFRAREFREGEVLRRGAHVVWDAVEKMGEEWKGIRSHLRKRTESDARALASLFE